MSAGSSTDSSTPLTSPDDVIHFWVGDPSAPGADPLAKAELWWKKDDAFDREIRERFGDTHERAVRGELDAWKAMPRGRLALVLLYDQLSRNMFRGSARAFAQDSLAQDLAKKAFDAGDDRVLASIEVSFLLMPFMHAEDSALQQRAIDGFEKLRDAATDEKLRKNFDSCVGYGARHKAIVDRFGRFPHRNAILGRPSTSEETEFLKQPGSSF
ncbi:MAG: putative transrane protein [Myxococcaceae bacterium]|nr:putative transrane protein [Myxococcaceae bacterium]MEA2747081.1 hypothetical protein [Myxococcales bacterium]